MAIIIGPGINIGGGISIGNGTVSNVKSLDMSANGGAYIQYDPGTIIGYNAFTFEVWFKLTSAPTERYLTGSTGSSPFATIGFPLQTQIGVYPMAASTGTFTVPSMSLNTWHNLVVTRTPAYTTFDNPFSAPATPGTGYFAVAVWVDGNLATSGIVLNSGGTNTYSTKNNVIGYASGSSPASNFNGKISSMRWSNSCRFFPYTGSVGNLIPVSTIAVPTSPYSTDANTVLLINPTSSTITDSSGTNTIGTYTATYDSTDSPF